MFKRIKQFPKRVISKLILQLRKFILLPFAYKLLSIGIAFFIISAFSPLVPGTFKVYNDIDGDPCDFTYTELWFYGFQSIGQLLLWWAVNKKFTGLHTGNITKLMIDWCAIDFIFFFVSNPYIYGKYKLLSYVVTLLYNRIFRMKTKKSLIKKSRS